MPRATFRFYEELNDFLPSGRQKLDLEYRFLVSPSVKDAIESFGVPHTEIDLIIADVESVGFEHRVEDGMRVAVYPLFESFDITPIQRLRPAPLRHPAFVVDVNLGRLARLLRLLGIDASYRNDYADAELAEISRLEQRAILTRDIGVLKRSAVRRGYYVRSDDPEEQIREVIRRFDLIGQISLYGRCTLCNGEIGEIDLAEITHRLPPGTRSRLKTAYQCRGCGKLYWRGSHEKHALALLERVLG